MKFPFVVVIFLAALVLFLVAANILWPRKQTVKKLGATTANGNGKRFGWLTKPGRNFWTVLLVIVAAVILYFGLFSQKWETPSLSSVWAWSWEHWFWILVFWGVLAALVALLGGGAKEALQTILIIVVLMLLVGIPFISWIESPSSPGQQKVAEVRTLTMPPNGNSPRLGMTVGRPFTFTGDKFKTICIYADGHEGIVGDPVHPCVDGPIISVYVHDLSGKANSVTYKFAK